MLGQVGSGGASYRKIGVKKFPDVGNFPFFRIRAREWCFENLQPHYTHINVKSINTKYPKSRALNWDTLMPRKFFYQSSDIAITRKQNNVVFRYGSNKYFTGQCFTVVNKSRANMAAEDKTAAAKWKRGKIRIFRITKWQNACFWISMLGLGYEHNVEGYKVTE